MKLTGIYTYPVKALRGGSHQACDVLPWGLSGDRNWMVVDQSGRFITQRQYPVMATISAQDSSTGLLLSDQGGHPLAVPTPDATAPSIDVTVWRDRVPASLAMNAAHDWLSERLGLACRLVHLRDTRARKINPQYDSEGRTVSFADGFPLLLAGMGSLDDLNARLERPVPMGRFRPNIVIEGAEPWEEDSWRRIRIGEVVLRIAKPCERCTVTTIDPLSGRRPDPAEPLQTLGLFRLDARGGVMFGQNIIPERCGRIHVGDAVEVLERGPPNVELLPPVSAPPRHRRELPAPRRARVMAIDHLAPDVRRLVMRVEDEPPLNYRAGQYVSLVLPDGSRRSLSPACAARPDGVIEFHVQRRDGGVLTRLVFGEFKPGDIVGLEGPYGLCVLDDGAGPIVMLATGTGIAPMLAILQENALSASPRPITLYWGGRTKADLYAADSLIQTARAQPYFRFIPVLSSLGRYVQDHAARDFSDLSGIAVYACGSPRMVESARQRLSTLPGASTDNFYADAFEAAGAGERASLDAPTIQVSVSDKTVAVALGASLLQGLTKAGLPIQSVCGGHSACGTCRVRLSADWAERLAPAGKAEKRLLGVLRDPDPAHRLACQIIVEAQHLGLALALEA